MKKTLYFGLMILSTACGGGQQGFDTRKWASDKNACQGTRTAMLADFEKIRPNLRGLNELGVREWLGAPDQIELAERNQRFYVYHIRPGKACGAAIGTEADRIRIRFDAINRVNEVSLALPE